MRALRLDLGADCVAIPSRDLVVIHPDLDYAEALGAVMGTLPDLHPDQAQCLVEQVTPRPRETKQSTVSRLAASAVTLGVVLVAALGIGPSPAAATPEFGDIWRSHMTAFGLDCHQGRGMFRTCYDTDRDLVKVQGFHRADSDLYLVPTDDGCRNVLIFDEQDRAMLYASNHPRVERTGRVVVW